MYATVRRYEGIDEVRSEEITRKVVNSLVPNIGELPDSWISEHDLESALPNAPHITNGPLIALEPQRVARS